MQEIIEAMQMRLRELRQRAAAIQSNRSPEANPPGKYARGKMRTKRHPPALSDRERQVRGVS